MIPWWGAIMAFFIGAVAGWVILALIVVARAEKENGK